jgi:glycine cleavage system aminomethyltransferase T
MFAPTLNRPAALALVRRGSAVLGSTVDIDLRGTLCRAEVAKKPFYKRPG